MVPRQEAHGNVGLRVNGQPLAAVLSILNTHAPPDVSTVRCEFSFELSRSSSGQSVW